VISKLRLDDLLETQKLQRVVKMDIEGSEVAALSGGSATLRKHQPALLLEVSGRALNSYNAKSADVLLFPGDYGYQVYGFDPDSGSPLPVVPGSYLDSQNIIAIAGGSLP
jgi:hypothetical protein